MKNQWFLRRNLLARLSLAVGLLTSATVLTTKAAFIVNGSFEAPAKSPGFYTGVPGEWFMGGGQDATSYIVNNSGGGMSTIPVAQDGNQYVGLIANTGWTLNQTFTVPTAGDYEFSWYDNATIGYGYSYTVRLLSGASTVYSSVFGGTGSTSWHLQSRQGLLNAGTYTLQFGFPTSGGGATPFWDNVSVETVTVPEPTSIIAGALLLLPFAASTLTTLRKRLPRSS